MRCVVEGEREIASVGQTFHEVNDAEHVIGALSARVRKRLLAERVITVELDS